MAEGPFHMTEAPFHQAVSQGPDAVSAYWISTEDDLCLRVALWETQSAPKGTIFILQGRTENLEKYGLVATALTEAGYKALAIDWRGQGLSDRLSSDPLLGHVERFEDYQKDIAAMVQSATALGAPRPWFLLGHSLGGCVGLRAIMNGLPVEACAFTAPLWDLNLPPLQKIGAWPLSWGAQVLGKGQSYAPGTKGESYVLHTPFDENRLTHDPEMYQYYINISQTLVDQQIGGPSMQWLYQALRETSSLAKAPSPSIPCVTFCGETDSIVATPAAARRMASWPQGRLRIVPKAKHDVLYEIREIREGVMREIIALFDAHTGAGHPKGEAAV